MSKIDPLPPLASGFRSSQRLNVNLAAIEAALQNTLSRDGSAPNQMEAPLDMNSEPIINLPAPTLTTEPVRLGDVTGLFAEAEAAVAAAEVALAAAQAAQAQADALYASVQATESTVIQAALDATLAQVAAEAAQAASEAAAALSQAQVALAAAQVALATAQAASAANSAAEAASLLSQTELAAMAAGAPLYSTMPLTPFTGVPSPFLFSDSAGVSVWTHNGVTATQVGWLGKVHFDTVALLLAHTGTLDPVGNIIEAGLHRYQVVASGQHVTTSGGSKLIVLPSVNGLDLEAFGVDLTGTTAANTILGIAGPAAIAADMPLVLRGGTILINATITITARLTVLSSGRINITAGTMTLNGEFRAGLHGVFTITAGVGPTWGPHTVDFIRPEWFGAKARGSSSAQFNSYTGINSALAASARGTSGFTYLVQLSQGIYDVGTQLSWPVAGANTLRGIGSGISQIRGMDAGSGMPNTLINFITGTADSRIEHLSFFGGTTRSVNYGLTGAEMKHTHVKNCSFAGFIIAAINSIEWDNSFDHVDFSNCGVGIWTSRVGNNNDITIDKCTFVGCDVSVALGAGANQRIRNCQFQAALAAPFTKTHIYAQGVTGMSVDNCYFESQAPVGMAGMAFTVPSAVRIFADIIFNNSPYYTDTIGTVTTTLAQNSSASGSVCKIDSCNFASPTYYTAGAGGTGYTAGAVTLTATNGTGSGASGTITVSGSSVSSITATVPGTDFQIGDRVLVDQGGNVSASAIVQSVTTNNAISTLMIGGNAAIYPGHVRSLTLDTCNVGNAYLVLYDDQTVCNPRKVMLTQCVKASGNYDYQILGSNTNTVSAALRNVQQDNLGFIMSQGLDSGSINYFPSTWAYTPTVSTLTRSAGRYQGFPYYRLTLNAGQQTSDSITGSFSVNSSGIVNGDLPGRRIYFSVAKAESAANVKLRLTLTVVSGTSTIMRQNYDTSTAFTKSSGIGREEVSIVIPTNNSTVSYSIQVIASTAGSQFVEFFAPVIAPVGFSCDSFHRELFSRPLTATDTYDPANLVAGASEATKVIAVPGARVGDKVTVIPPYSLQGMRASGYVSTSNNVTIVLTNTTAGALDLASGTWRVEVDPTT